MKPASGIVVGAIFTALINAFIGAINNAFLRAIIGTIQ
jgi:large-conductance mechanosensitive channel